MQGKRMDCRRWVATTMAGAWLAVAQASAADAVRLCASGTTDATDFTKSSPTQSFDVLNTGAGYVMVVFESNPHATVTPGIVRLAPDARGAIQMSAAPGVQRLDLRYAVSESDSPFKTNSDRYRAYHDGETVRCVPVAPALFQAMQARAASIIRDSKELVTDKAMPAGTYVYTPGPFYRAAGLFARDFLYQLEGSGRDLVTAAEVRNGVDFLALKQLTANRKVGAFTYPKGAIVDHLYPDGRYAWGPGLFYGDTPGHFRRPSLDEAMCFITLAWHAGYKAGWDSAWQSWFKAKAERFAEAWNSVPRNPKTGLVTQWTTEGHVGANGITETTGACVMWGFHDSYGFGGDDLGTSVLACNAAHALADMHDHAGNSTGAQEWSRTADAMRDAIRAQFVPAGYLPWGVGPHAPTMASPDITGYAVWSGILTDTQADAASDWFAECYHADKKEGGAADLFQMTPGLRGAVRMARKADDCAPGRHVWPDQTEPHWENLAFGYNAYQNGGYWYYMSLGVAKTLWRRHPTEASEWVGDAYADVTSADGNHPYERIDGVKPQNNRYNASVGPLLGMGMPATVVSVKVIVRGNSPTK